jgi:hypothetical protein
MTFRPWELKNRVILHTLRMPDDHCGDGEELNSNEEEPALSYLQVECLKTQLRGYLRAEPTPEEPTPYQIVSDAARAYLSFPVSARLGHIYACARNALPGVVPSRDVELADETFTEYCWYFADQLDQARIRWAVGLEEVYTSADFLPAYASAMCELRLWKLAIKAADRAGIWR